MPNDNANITQYKNRLSDYLDYKGITKKKDRYSCVSSQHEDNDPSASIYENGGNNKLNCNSCGFKGDIFDCAGELIGMKGQDHFQDQLKEIQSVFGGEPFPMKPEKKKGPTKKQEINVVPLPRDTALEKFSSETILKMCGGVFNGFGDKEISEDHKDFRKFTAVGWYPYYNADGLIDLMVVRLEDQNNKKEVLTYYCNGQNVAMKSYPILIYGRDQLAKSPDLPVLIHEGEKCVKSAMESMTEFVHIGWNGGGKKFYIPDWSVLKGREVFLLPDDDAPGIDTMGKLKKLLKGDYGIDSIVVPIFEKAKSIKKKGADIEEILQCYSPEEITKTIFELRNAPRQKEENSENEQGYTDNNDNSEYNNSGRVFNDSDGGSQDKGISGSGYPFKILGIADDGKAYFLDHTDRMLGFETTAINANMLSDIGTYNYFKQNHFGHHDPTAKEWLSVIDEIRILSKKTDFDMEKVRGRGAWKDNDGNICYHDGKKTTGKYDPEWTFIRKPQKKIGIDSAALDLATRQEIIRTAQNFSFATPADCIRLLSWAVLACFSGALTWRPAFQLTGESGTGKSTLMNMIRKISQSLAVNGGSTTEAAIRQYCGTDSGSTTVDEAESKNHRDRDRIEGIFSLMRASTSDDSPKTIKGSKNGNATVFEMRQMFGFASINASVDNVADDNRIIRINLKRSEKPGYLKNIKKINDLLNHKNCEGIRAFTWQNLTKIISLSERLGYIIQEVTKQDQRFADGESILLAANMMVWEDHRGDEKDDYLIEYVNLFYKNQTHEVKRDETEEMINRLLDETVTVGDERKKYSFRFLLKEMRQYLEENEEITTAKKSKRLYQDDGITPIRDETRLTKQVYRDYKRVVEQYGMSVHGATKEIAIAQNHHEIIKILDTAKGYNRQLGRHKNVLFNGECISVNMDSTTKRATIIAGFLEYNLGEEEG